MAQEKSEFGRNKHGMTLEELKDAVLDDEWDRKEESRRQDINGKNQEKGNANFGTGRTQYTKNRSFSKPSCIKCGYSPDGHTKDNCPNLGLFAMDAKNLPITLGSSVQTSEPRSTTVEIWESRVRVMQDKHCRTEKVKSER